MTDKLFKTYTINLVILILLKKFNKLEYRDIKNALALTLERKVSKGSISGTLNRLGDEGLIRTKVGKIKTKMGEEPVVFYEITKKGVTTVNKSVEYHQKIQNNINNIPNTELAFNVPGLYK